MKLRSHHLNKNIIKGKVIKFIKVPKTIYSKNSLSKQNIKMFKKSERRKKTFKIVATTQRDSFECNLSFFSLPLFLTFVGSEKTNLFWKVTNIV